MISRTFEDYWPPYFPDLSPHDSNLWGYLKSKVHEDPVPATLEELKKNIRREVWRIKPETLRKVYDNVLDSKECLQGMGHEWNTKSTANLIAFL